MRFLFCAVLSGSPTMPFDAIAEQRSVLLWILLCGGAGMILSRVPNISRSDVSEIRRSPVLPRAAFFALWLSLIPMLDSPWFRTRHVGFIVVLVVCALSTGRWLSIAVFFLANVEYRRSQRIEEFISDPSLPVPTPITGREGAPKWLQTWKWLNTVVFLALFASIVYWLIDLPSA
jgi:hypothetical protein